MTPEELAAANDSQIRTFINGYDPFWRLAKINLLADVARNAERTLQVVKEEIPDADERYIYGPVRNGLLFDAVSEIAMYSEDLFALLRALHHPTHFVKRLITYKAGQVTAIADRLSKLTVSDVARLFFLPPRSFFESPNDMAEPSGTSAVDRYDETVRLLQENLSRAVFTFRIYNEYYIQYKHGLTVALKFLKKPVPEEGMGEKRGSTDGFLCIYENDNLAGTNKRGSMVIPELTPEIKPHLKALIDDRNLLKAHYMLGDVSLDGMRTDAKVINRLIWSCIYNNSTRRRCGREFKIVCPTGNGEALMFSEFKSFSSPPPIEYLPL